MAEGNLYVVTGSSGTGVARAIARYCGQRHVRAKYRKVEDYLCVRTAKYWAPLLRDNVAADYIPSLREAFRLPEQVLREEWPGALRQCLAGDRVPRAAEEGSRPIEADLHDGYDVFLTFHASWFHLEWRSFVSGVHVRELRAALVEHKVDPRLVINLIDDCYATYARLRRRRDGIFHDSTEPVLDLLRILEWREAEFRSSQDVALAQGVPHILFAVQHPMSTFQKLLTSPPTALAYLSHPISSPRERGLESEASRAEVAFIQSVGAGLREAEDVVLFEPTSIDELRLASVGRGSKRRLLPTLTPRWPAMLTSQGQNAVPLGDISHEEAALADDPFAASPAADRRNPRADAQLALLSSKIRDGIAWRDRYLVHQSAVLFVVRPCPRADGRYARGVADEIKLHRALRSYDLMTTRKTVRLEPFVYHDPRDEFRRRAAAVVEVLAVEGRGQRLRNWTGAASEELRGRLTEDDLEQWTKLSPDDVGERVLALLEGLTRSRRVRPVPEGGEGGTLGEGQAQTGLRRATYELGERVRTTLIGTESSRELVSARLSLHGVLPASETDRQAKWIEREIHRGAELARDFLALMREERR